MRKISWEQSLHQGTNRPVRKAPRVMMIPWSAIRDRRDGTRTHFLVRDLAALPLRLGLTALNGLRALGTIVATIVPTVVVASTTVGRATAQKKVLDEACGRSVETPQVGQVATWRELCLARYSYALDSCPGQHSFEGVIIPVTLRVRSLPIPGASPPHRIGRKGHTSDRPRRGGPDDAQHYPAAADRTRLDFIRRLDCLASKDLQVVMDRSVLAMVRRWRFPSATDLTRPDGPDLVGRRRQTYRVRLLTAGGIVLIAAQSGQEPAETLRPDGLFSDGPSQPNGSRGKPPKRFGSGRGVDDLLVRLVATARKLAATGRYIAVRIWHSSTACRLGHVGRDGHGPGRFTIKKFGFFLVNERDKLGVRGCQAKLAAHADLLASRRYARDDGGSPSILQMAADNAAERIERCAWVVANRRAVRRPLLLTAKWWLAGDHSPPVLVERCWRLPDSGVRSRRTWLPEGVLAPNFVRDGILCW
jgi:hypothetical protein